MSAAGDILAQSQGKSAGRGRPTDYSPEIAATICARMSEGRSLRSICRDDPDMPAASSVYLWLNKYKEFSENYAIAREQRADAIYEDTLEIADETKGDITVDEDGNEIVNHENIQRSRLRVDTRKWFLSKLSSKYAERSVLAGDPNAPLLPAGQTDQRQIVINLLFGALEQKSKAAQAVTIENPPQKPKLNGGNGSGNGHT